MRVGVDLFALVPGVGRGAGFHRYTSGLLEALSELDDAHRYYLFVNRLNASMFPAGGRFVQVIVPLPPQRYLWPLRLLWQHVLLPVMAWQRRLDLVHFPMDTASAFLPCPYVVTIHDLITDVYYPIHFRGSVSPLKAQYLFMTKRRSARRACKVICPSNATAEQASRHYGVPPEKIVLVPYAAHRHFLDHVRSTNVRSSSQRPYILSVVSLSPHKNIETLIQSFIRARRRFDLPHELHIVGMPGMDPRRAEKSLRSEEARRLPIHYLGFVDELELEKAYAAAALFVFLPFVEGFGLPPLEAMAMGVPVVASNVSSIPEVCGDAALLVPPDDADAVAQAIGTVLTTPAKARELVEAGRQRARQFSWTKAAVRTRATYEVALGSRER